MENYFIFLDRQIPKRRKRLLSKKTRKGHRWLHITVRTEEHRKVRYHYSASYLFLNDYFHKCSRYIADYCRNKGINRVIIGDITGIRKGYDKGDRLNQQFHSLPYAQIYTMLEYKLKLYGITLKKQNEAYSSQVSPLAEKVCRENAHASDRITRGLYNNGNSIYNADAVGAYNILRL